MATRKRTRKEKDKIRRKFTDRIKTLRTKTEEINTTTPGRVAIISTFDNKTIIYGDERLLEDLGYIARAYPSLSNRSTLSPTNSTSSASSASALPHTGRPETPASSFNNGDIPSLQEAHTVANLIIVIFLLRVPGIRDTSGLRL